VTVDGHTEETILGSYLRSVKALVSREVAADDHMFPASGEMSAYLNVGQAALQAVTLAQMSVGQSQPQRIMDFGCGAGRVTRWFRAAYPAAHLTASELRQESLDFVCSEFDATPHVSSQNLRDLTLPGAYDLIWVGSVITHLSESDSRFLLDRLFGALEPGGVMVFTTHGRKMLQNQILGRHEYITPNRFIRLIAQATVCGYGHAPHVDGGYSGISVTTMSWIAQWCGSSPERRLVGLTEMGWCDHQDVVAVTKSTF